MTNRIQVAANKKGPINEGPDVKALSLLSKFALLDLLVESLRIQSGRCDEPVEIETLREFCNRTLQERGDRQI
jgi:hypothetical protein